MVDRGRRGAFGLLAAPIVAVVLFATGDGHRGLLALAAFAGLLLYAGGLTWEAVARRGRWGGG